MKLKVLITIALLALASVASGQLIYDEVKVEVAPGVACPSSWTASSEAVTLPAVYRVLVPASIGGRSFRVTARFADLIWPTPQDKAAAVAAGNLVNEAGRVVTRHYCSLLP